MSAPQTLTETTVIDREDELMVTQESTNLTKRIKFKNLTKDLGSGSTNRFATRAAAMAAIAIEEGQEGYIPDNGIIIIDDENAYISGEEVTVE